MPMLVADVPFDVSGLRLLTIAEVNGVQYILLFNDVHSIEDVSGIYNLCLHLMQPYDVKPSVIPICASVACCHHLSKSSNPADVSDKPKRRQRQLTLFYSSASFSMDVYADLAKPYRQKMAVGLSKESWDELLMAILESKTMDVPLKSNKSFPILTEHELAIIPKTPKDNLDDWPAENGIEPHFYKPTVYKLYDKDSIIQMSTLYHILQTFPEQKNKLYKLNTADMTYSEAKISKPIDNKCRDLQFHPFSVMDREDIEPLIDECTALAKFMKVIPKQLQIENCYLRKYLKGSEKYWANMYVYRASFLGSLGFHFDNLGTPAINLMIGPKGYSSKVWIFIGNTTQNLQKFLELRQSLLSSVKSEKHELWITPQKLKQNGVQFYCSIQMPGDLIIVPPMVDPYTTGIAFTVLPIECIPQTITLYWEYINDPIPLECILGHMAKDSKAVLSSINEDGQRILSDYIEKFMDLLDQQLQESVVTFDQGVTSTCFQCRRDIKYLFAACKSKGIMCSAFQPICIACLKHGHYKACFHGIQSYANYEDLLSYKSELNRLLLPNKRMNLLTDATPVKTVDDNYMQAKFLNKVFDWLQQLPEEAKQEIELKHPPMHHYGHLSQFKTSPFKFISIGYNPSSNDSLVSQNLIQASFYDNMPSERNQKLIEQINDNYFNGQTHQYFNNLETFANVLNASYYKSKPSTAIHMDMLCYCATKQAWGDVKNKAALSAGLLSHIWWDIAGLSPHFVFFSVALEHVKKMSNCPNVEWKEFLTITKKNKCTIMWAKFPSFTAIQCVPQQNPFGFLSKTEVKQLAKKCMKDLLGLSD